ncbi:MAG: DUF2071 domain-containing protein [Ferruginibacter sp.]
MAIFLKAKWENIIMANYAVPAEVLQPFLPNGLSLDLYNEKAHVSLVGFMFSNTKLFNIPIPRLGTFEEINLRFYVLREEGNTIKRGVVFVNETIPYKAVAWIANKLYREHYLAIPTKHSWAFTGSTKQIGYQWKINNGWNSIKVDASVAGDTMQANSFEEFIFEHYYGYTKINAATTEEYKINHPSWKINQVFSTTINCDFGTMYGKPFEFLNTAEPASVFIAEGSAIEVEWKRSRLNL